MIERELLDILVCPVCKTNIGLEDEKLVCKKCGRRYPVKDGIPVMLAEEAQMPGENRKEG